MNTTEFRNLIANAPAQPVSIITVTQAKKLLRYHRRQDEIIAWLNQVGIPVKSIKGVQKLKKADLMALFLTPHGTKLPEELVEPLMADRLENPYYGRVTCTAKRLGFIGSDYESVVNRQRCREADEGTVPEPFVAESLWGGNGEHVTKTICRHKISGKEYLAFLPRQKQAGDVVNSWTRYNHAVTGQEIDAKAFDDFWPNNDSEGRQGVEIKREWRVIELENIVEITLAGATYRVERHALAA